MQDITASCHCHSICYWSCAPTSKPGDDVSSASKWVSIRFATGTESWIWDWVRL